MTASSINEFLHDIVDRVVNDLAVARLVNISTDEAISPSNLGYLCSYYYITYKTAELFATRIAPGLSLIDCIELMTEAEEYKQLPVRHNEGEMNRELCEVSRFKHVKFTFDSPHTKTYLLLQVYFSRAKFPITDYALDAKSVIDNCARIIFFLIDVAIDNKHLDTTLNLINLAQMLVHGLWIDDRSTMCLPNVNYEEAKLIDDKLGISHLAEIVEDPEKTTKIIDLLQLDGKKKLDLKKFVDRVPNVKVSLSARGKEQLKQGELTKVKVSLEKRNNKESNDVRIKLTNKIKSNRFYVILADEKNNRIVDFAKLTLKGKSVKTFDIEWPENKNLKVFLMNDSYFGIDQEYVLNVNHLNEFYGEDFGTEKDTELTVTSVMDNI